MMAGLQAFLQAFPNLGCFAPRISKESFGGFVEFQRVTRAKNPSVYIQTFSPRHPPFGHIFGAVGPLSADPRHGSSSSAGRSVYVACWGRAGSSWVHRGCQYGLREA